MHLYQYIPNYTGPYISDGKFQSSVQFGNAPAINSLDLHSRYHDTAYAKWPSSRLHRMAADNIYYDAVRKHLSLPSKVAAGAVRYVNQIANFYSDINVNSDDYQRAYQEVINLYSMDPWIGGGGVNENMADDIGMIIASADEDKGPKKTTIKNFSAEAKKYEDRSKAMVVSSPQMNEQIAYAPVLNSLNGSSTVMKLDPMPTVGISGPMERYKSSSVYRDMQSGEAGCQSCIDYPVRYRPQLSRSRMRLFSKKKWRKVGVKYD